MTNPSLAFVPQNREPYPTTRRRWLPALSRRDLLWAALACALGLVTGLAIVLPPSPLFAVAVLAGVLAGMLMLTQAQFSLNLALLVATLLPFGVIPVRIGLTLTLTEAIPLLLFVVWGARLAARANERRERNVVGSGFDWAILLFVGLSLFSFITNLAGEGSITVVHNYFKTILSIVFFWVVLNLVQTQPQLEMVVRTIIVGGGGSAAVGLIFYYIPRALSERLLLALVPLGYPSVQVLRYTEDNPALPLRATSTSVDPNNFGGLLVLIFALAFTQLLSPRPVLRKWLLAPIALATLAALALTYSSNAQGAVVVVLLFVATVSYRRLWLYIVPVAVAGYVLLPIVQPALWQRLLRVFNWTDQASVMRLNEYRNAFAIIARYPYFGVGFDQAPSRDLTTGVSSVYLTIAERMGLIGLAAFLLVMLLFFVTCLGGLRRITDGAQRTLVLGLCAGVAGALAVGTLDHFFFNIEYSAKTLLLWTFMALAVAQIKIARSPVGGVFRPR